MINEITKRYNVSNLEDMTMQNFVDATKALEATGKR